MSLVRRVLFVGLFVVVFSGCSGTGPVEADRPLFGLSLACHRNVDEAVLTSPGLLVLDAGEVMEDLQFDIQSSDPDLVIVPMLVDGGAVGAGTVANAADFLPVIEGATVPDRLEGPLEMDIVLLRNEAIESDATVTIERVDYVLNGQAEYLITDFTWEIQETCF